MSVFDLFDRSITFFDTALHNTFFYLTRAPLFMQFLDICVLNFPDLLDVQTTSYGTVPIYFVAGAVDYGLISIAVSLYRQASSPWAPTSDAAFHALNDRNTKLCRTALLLSFIFRGWNFGLSNIQRCCAFKTLCWAEMRKLCLLILILCPSLYWHCFLETLIHALRLNPNRPWLPQLFLFLMTADWETASLFSGFYISKGKQAIQEDNAKMVNQTIIGIAVKSLKITAIAAPLEILISNLPAISLGVVIAIQFLTQAIEMLVKSWGRKLRGLTLVKNYLMVENSIIANRDHLVMAAIRLLRSKRSRKYLVYSQDFSRPFLSVCHRSALSIWSCCKLLFVLTKSPLKHYLKFQSSTAATLEQEPLNSRRIRLLEVNSSPFSRDIITCSLSWHDLSTAPKYTAISYVWGSGERIATIILNGKVYKTTASARDALKGLRSRWLKKKVWIDAICIDQDSVEDKAEQISMMADIYKNADKVTVWLGADEDGGLALSLARRLWIRTRLAWRGSLQYSSDAPQHSWMALRRLLKNSWFERSWVVQEVMSGKVIIQYGDAKLSWSIFSMFAISVDNYSQILQKLYLLEDDPDNSPHSDAKPNILKIKYIRVFEEFRSITIGREGSEHLSLLFYLIRMFRSSCRFKATVTKDRIYALVNLCGLANHPKFRLDYKPYNRKPFDEVDLFIEVAQYLLSSGRENCRMDLLAHAGIGHGYGSGGRRNLPSWVPDWSLENCSSMPLIGQDGTSELLQHPRIDNILKDISNLRSYDEISYNQRPKQEAALKNLKQMAQTMINTTLYRAAGKTLPSIKIHSEPGNILELKGVYLDRIMTIGLDFPSLLPDPTAARALDDLQKIASVLISWNYLVIAPLLSDTQSAIDAKLLAQSSFYRTLLADLSHPVCDFALQNTTIRPAPDSKVQDFERYYTALFNSASGKLDLAAFLQSQDESARAKFQEIDTHIRTVCSGRVLGITYGGRFGLFLQGSKIDDEMCLFHGAGLPFILRKVGKVAVGQEAGLSVRPREEENEESTLLDEDGKASPAYELIGAAYVHGIMDGEAMLETAVSRRFFLK